MLTGAFMRSLTGPTPTPFTGDPAQAVQFLDEFGQLVRANQAHLLVTRPELRVELALSFIRGQTTNAWKRVVPRRRTAEPADETLWDDFIDSFCVTWVDPPASLPVIMTAPPPRPLRSPRRPFSPRLASPIASTLDLVKPVDELPPTHPVSAPARAGDLVIPVHGENNAATVPSPVAPSTLVPDVDGVIDLTGSDLDEWALFAPRTELTTSLAASAATHDESYDLPLPLTVTPDPLATASAAQRAEERPTTAPVNDNKGSLVALRNPARTTPAVPALTASVAHASDGTTKKRKRKADGEDDTRPGKRVHAQLARRSVPFPRKHRYEQRRPVVPPPPVDDSSGLSTSDLDGRKHAQPARPQHTPPSPVTAPTAPLVALLLPCTVVEDDNSLRRGVKTLGTSVFATNLAVSPVPTSPATSPDPPTTRREPPITTPTAGDDDWTLFAPRHSVKTTAISTSPQVSNEQTPHTDASVRPRSPRHAHIFPPNALEQPRDPDEVAPATPQHTSQHPRASAAGTTSHPQNSGAPRNRDGHAYTARRTVEPAGPQPASPRRHRANAAVTTPRPPNANTEATRNRDRQTRSARPVPRPPIAPEDTRPTRDRNQLNTTAADRIRAWLARIVYELLPRPYPRTAPSNRDPVADDRADCAHRNYEYDYRDARRED
ncbi:hypothetical protein EDB85DRAFT_2283004 [Lactarius pseudohatsudake]|nr:hypothetical protein EDB85DRAFT_2283004 [Lactarius pseudohatsudake]